MAADSFQDQLLHPSAPPRPSSAKREGVRSSPPRGGGLKRGGSFRPSIGRALDRHGLGWFALLILVPTLELLRQAFANGVRPLVQALAEPEARKAFGLTLGITVVAVLVNTIFGVAFAVVLVRQRFWGKALADGLVDLPFAVSPVVAGLMLIVLYGPNGWIGRRLEAAGFQVVYSLPGMVLATMFVTLPFVVREVVPVLREFGVEQEEAAFTLGAGRSRPSGA